MANLAYANAIASAAFTASGPSAAAGVLSYSAWEKGLALILHVTAVTGTSPTLIPAIQVQDPVNNVWVTVHTPITVTITATGDYLIELYPGMLDALAAYPVRLNAFLAGLAWRLNYTIGGTTPSFTLSVDAALIP
jgi:hypothetical protein